MRYAKERPDTAKAGRAETAEAAHLKPHSNINNHPTVIYQASGQHAPVLVALGAREYEMVRALSGRGLTRVGLSRVHPRLGLNATGTVARLRRKGVQIESIWHKITDAEGRSDRFVSYWLIGKVLGVVL
jgi:hypothetical protein